MCRLKDATPICREDRRKKEGGGKACGLDVRVNNWSQRGWCRRLKLIKFLLLTMSSLFYGLSILKISVQSGLSIFDLQIYGYVESFPRVIPKNLLSSAFCFLRFPTLFICRFQVLFALVRQSVLYPKNPFSIF
jgi:hypothetical protein